MGNGSLRELTKRYREALESHGVEHWAPPDLNWEAFAKGLTIVDEISSCPGCLKGGGRESCELRRCTASRDLAECGACHEQASCPHVQLLNDMRAGALRAGLFVKIKPGKDRALIEQWSDELKAQWPSCVLFIDQTVFRARRL